MARDLPVIRSMDDHVGTVVLVAEDDPHALSGYIEFLEGSGFTVSGSSDGEQALAAALDISPDIVVTDMMMPRLDGFGLAGALRADSRTRHIPVVGMTGCWNTVIQRDAQWAGVNAMLLKPFLPGHLLAEIERVLRHTPSEEESSLEPAPGSEGAMPAGLRNAARRRAQR